MRRILVVGLTIVLSACAAMPSAKYTLIAKPEDMKDVADTFYLQQSMLKVDLTEKAAAGDKPAIYSISVMSAPTEHRALKIGILPKSDWMTKSTVNLAKRDNTGLIKSAAVDIADYRVETINKIGGLVVKLVGLSATEDALGRDSFPVVTNISAFLEANEKPREGFTIEPEANGGVTVVLSSVGPSAVKREDLPSTWIKALPYSACREAVVSFKYIDPTHTDPNTQARILTYEGRVQVADPFYIEYAPLPRKGQVNFHSECGVSVVPESPQASPGLAIAEALLTQAIAVDKALNPEETKGGGK